MCRTREEERSGGYRTSTFRSILFSSTHELTSSSLQMCRYSEATCVLLVRFVPKYGAECVRARVHVERKEGRSRTTNATQR